VGQSRRNFRLADDTSTMDADTCYGRTAALSDHGQGGEIRKLKSTCDLTVS